MVGHTNADITVIARAKFRSEVASLHHAGITNVIHDEMETGAAAVRLAKQSFDIIEPSDAPSLSH